MVSINFLNQRQKEVSRKERLSLTRKKAAELSVNRAREYNAQKRLQIFHVEHSLRVQWEEYLHQKQLAIERLVDVNEAKRGEGVQQADTYNIAQVNSAHEEVGAWQSEYELEDARYRLARSIYYVEQQQKNRSLRNVAEFHKRVKDRERIRTAQVVSGPKSQAYSSIAQSLASPVYNTTQPCVTVANPSASQVDVLKVCTDRNKEFCRRVNQVASVVARNMYEQKVEIAKALRTHQKKTSKRAKEILYQKHLEELQKHQKENEKNELRKTIMHEYQYPALIKDEGEVNLNKRGTMQAKQTMKVQYPETRRQEEMQSYKIAEQDFARTFLHSSTLSTQDLNLSPVSLERSVENLLQTVYIKDLSHLEPSGKVYVPLRVYSTHIIYPHESAESMSFGSDLVDKSMVCKETQKDQEQESMPGNKADPFTILVATENSTKESPGLNSASKEVDSHMNVTTKSPDRKGQPSLYSVAMTSASGAGVKEVDDKLTEGEQREPLEVSHFTEGSTASLISTLHSTSSSQSAGESLSTRVTSSDYMFSDTSSLEGIKLPQSRNDVAKFKKMPKQMNLYPRMTAEQLKVALIRLRGRMNMVSL